MASLNSLTSQLNTHILIVDDEDTFRMMLRLHLEQAGYHVWEAQDPRQADVLLAQQPIDLILCDWKMPHEDGLSFIQRYCQITQDQLIAEVIFMSAHSQTEIALKAIDLGASDYLAKPFEISELLFRIKKVLHVKILQKALNDYEKISDQTYLFEKMIGKSDRMQSIFQLIRRVAQSNSTILIQGESGTGKELVARAIHQQSQCKVDTFIAINCAAIPPTLLESELFGHAKGAFTHANQLRKGLFEEANGGTIFLDEIGEIPLYLQAKLLRVIQEREVRRIGENTKISIDVRVIAATLKELSQEVKAGKFREDLFYRLNVIPVNLPALRERSEDIPLLVEHLLQRTCKRLSIPRPHVHPLLLEVMCEYNWPGNVRELENAIEHAVVLSNQRELHMSDLPRHINKNIPFSIMQEMEQDLSIKRNTQRLEDRLIRMALKKTQGIKSQAAQILEISTKTLLYKLKDYHINPDQISLDESE